MIVVKEKGVEEKMAENGPVTAELWRLRLVQSMGYLRPRVVNGNVLRGLSGGDGQTQMGGLFK